MENYDPKAFLGTGVKFPVGVDENTGRMMMVSYEDDIKEAIWLIIMTRKGERLRNPEFGCGIHDYVFSTIDYTIINSMQREVEMALIMWEPRIDNIKVSIDTGKIDEGMIHIHISYNVRSTNSAYNLVFPYYMNE